MAIHLPCMQFAADVASVSATALRVLDLRTHSATHPRLGAVDHISCHPLQPRDALAAAVAVAHGIARALSAADLQLPVLMYGAANDSGAKLRDLRRACGASTTLIVWYYSVIPLTAAQRCRQGALRP